MRHVYLTSVATLLPNRRVSNAELALEPALDSSELDRFGIFSRGVAGASESVVAMAVAAARAALEGAELAPEEVDFLLLANWSERRYTPDLAPLVQHELGATRAFAHDVGGACCGFLIALGNAWGHLQNPRLRRGLVVSSDRSTRRLRPKSRATIVFGDGAAAAVVDATRSKGWRISDFELRTNGAHHGIMEVDAAGYLAPHIPQSQLNPLAGESMASVARALLDRNGLTLDDIDYVLPHSGTAGVQEQLRAHLGVSPQKVLTNLPSVGNLTSASIPCSMRHFLDEGRLTTRDRVLALSVGLGWNYVATLFEGEGRSSGERT